MRRYHLFEWEDQPWLPGVFRDFITDHLRYTHNEPMREPISLAIAQRLRSVLKAADSTRIVDLCAGAGGPLLTISRLLTEQLAYPVEIVLTDLYPNASAFKRIEEESGGRIKGRYESTSALDVPPELRGVRTMFTALHHFRPEEARRVIADAVSKRSAIAVFEPLERTFRMAALLGLMSFLRGFTHTPRVGRLTVWRFLFTYVLPAAPAMLAWDGIVSVLRTYRADELHALALNSGGNTGYDWHSGRFEVQGPYGRMPTIYLIGVPVENGTQHHGEDTSDYLGASL